MDDRRLMELRVDTDFTHDTRGRMLQSNEPLETSRSPAPRLFLGCTRAGYVQRVGAAVPDSLARRLEALVDRHPTSGDIQAPPDVLAALRETLAKHAPIATVGGGPAYRFPDTIRSAGDVVPLTRANRALTQETYPWLSREVADWQPCFAVVRDGAAVAVCFSARLSPAAAEAGVDTLPEYRGRGFAATVTAAWGAAIRDTGRTPLYSTAWDNRASQGVAHSLGLVMFGSDTTWS